MMRFRSRYSLMLSQPWLRSLLVCGGMVATILLAFSQLPTQWTLAPEKSLAYAARPTPVRSPNLRLVSSNGVIDSYLSLVQPSYQLTQTMLRQEQGEASYARAIELAEQAVVLRKQGKASSENDQKEAVLWQAAIQALKSVGDGSNHYAKAQQKLTQYTGILAPINRRIEQRQSVFLESIASKQGNPNGVRVALCQLGTHECRNFRGDVPPVSLASLVKLPIAVALMHQVNTGQTSLDEMIYIDPQNFTENAQGAKIFVDKTYTLREVMVRMITESNNIATNQLVDYMGYDTINQALKAEGFTNTTVGHKLVGNSTYPKSMGFGRNRSSAHELTQMMMRIYSFTKASDEEILNALVGQYDLDFGYRALVKEKPDIFWIGEKTGQNSLVIGSTVAFKVGEERYVMTVTVDKSANQGRLRQIIRDVARHVLENGPLTQQATGAN